MTRKGSGIDLSMEHPSVNPAYGLPPLELQRLANPWTEVFLTPRPGINMVLTALLCSALLAVLGFVTIQVPLLRLDSLIALFGANEPATVAPHSRWMSVGFQIPFALMVGFLLGMRAGIFSVGLYLLVGLAAFPLFAAGGGWNYVFEPSAGYLLGLLAGVAVSGLLGEAFGERAALRLRLLWYLGKSIVSAVLGVLTVHLFGVVVLALQWSTGHLNTVDFHHYLLGLSLLPIGYDLVFSIIAMLLVVPLRLLLWIGLY